MIVVVVPHQVDYLLLWGIMEKFLPRLMEQHGLQGLLEQRNISGEVPTETVPWWWWVHQEPSLPLRMVLHGLLGLQEPQIFSGTSPTETVPLWQ